MSRGSGLDVVVIGGGAAGFFGAIACAEAYPSCRVTILERGEKVLSKVLVSGGGRCNVTNACFDPKTLVQNYPRGSKELMGPFYRFGPQDTMRWFESQGVRLKTEPDGRVFPVSDKSQTIADALIEAARKLGVETRLGVRVISIVQKERHQFLVTLGNDETMIADRLLLATGSNIHGHQWARSLGHLIEEPVPSLFTFNINDARLKGLPGVSVEKVQLNIKDASLSQEGPMLVTHWGLSGPAVLKLSAWGARVLHDLNYKARLKINWVSLDEQESFQRIQDCKLADAVKAVTAENPFNLPRRLWDRLAAAAGILADQKWAHCSRVQLQRLNKELTAGIYNIDGKSVFKEEFVICGGVCLREVSFKTMQSRRCPGLYFAGEILDIDGVTGGFNFQNAWTTGWLAGQSMGEH